MQIFIPSRSRFGIKSLTIERIQGGWEKEHEAFLVVPTAQRKQYLSMPNRGNIPVLGCPRDGIAGTRQWIGQRARNKFLMLDDDLRFFYRPLVRPDDDPLPGAGQPNEGPVRLYRSKPEHIAAMLATVERALDDYAHVGISPRDGNNNSPWPAWECKRPLRALAYRRGPFLAVEHGRVAIMEDFDVTMQLLERGQKNLLITEFAQDQYRTQLPGGCEDYRTHKLHEDNVRKFQSLHSEFVTLRQKANKHGGEFGHRLEATIYWKKAYEAALKELGL